MKRVFNGIRQVDGTKENFSESSLENGVVYFIRTSYDRSDGYLYLNGKRYGTNSDVSKMIGMLRDAVDTDFTELNNKLMQIDPTLSVREPLDSDTPHMYYMGDLPASKEAGACKGVLEYESATGRFRRYVTLKVQGSSSANYPKKNYTVTMYDDEDCTVKSGFDFKGWGYLDSFVLKANWVDHSHLRIIGTSEIWRQMVESRGDYHDLPEEMQSAAGHGATLGFSVRLNVNALYYGLYEVIIPKKYIFGQDKANPQHSLLVSESNRESLCTFSKSQWTQTEFDACWSEELQSAVPADAYSSFGDFMRLICDGTDEEVIDRLPSMVDVGSVIDFDILVRVFILRDSIGKNQLFATYDGVKWYQGAWDLDWSLNGSATSHFQNDYVAHYEGGLTNRLYERVEKLYLQDFKKRYFDLRAGVLSENSIIRVFERFNDRVAPWLDEDYAVTTGKGEFTEIPGKETSNIQSIRNAVHYRLNYMDGIVDAMANKVRTVVISVDEDAMTFTLSCPTAGAEIRYTLDGRDPDDGSSLYVGETAFEYGTTLKAVAFRDGYEASDVLEYVFEESEEIMMMPYKKLFKTYIRGLEKDVAASANASLYIYENRPEYYPLTIRGKYMSTASKYAFVNEDFIDNPVTANLVQVSADRYPYDASMTEPREVITEITDYVNTPYIAIVVMTYTTIPEEYQFKLYTKSRSARIPMVKADPVKVIQNKSIRSSEKDITGSSAYDIVLYDNVPSQAPYMIKGCQMVNNASRYAFVNEDFYNDPVTANLVSVSSETYPYSASQTVPKYYETPIGKADVVSDAPYIAITVCKNSNIPEEDRLALYVRQ